MTEKKTTRKKKAEKVEAAPEVIVEPDTVVYSDGGWAANSPVPAAMDGRQDPVSDKRTVKWTALGEEQRAHSEHGRHVAGEIVETDYAALLIERGFAEEV